MKRFARIMSLLVSAFLAVPFFTAAAAGSETPEFLFPMTFAEMYNDTASMFADQYYTKLGPETLEQVKEDCILAEEDADGQFLYLDSATGGVEAAFCFESDSFTEEDPAILWNFNIRRDLSGEAINLAAYSLVMVIGYNFRDSVDVDELYDWFNRLPDPDDVFELPGYTLSMAVTEEYIQYLMLPAADKNPLLKQDNSGNTAPLQDEIRFLNLPWGCDLETARILMEASGLLTEEAEGRFEMTRRHLEIINKMSGRGASEVSYTSFGKTENGYTADSGEEAANVTEVHLMSDMVKPYLGREVHNITLTFLVEDDTEKLLNVSVHYMISDQDVLPELIRTYGEPQLESGDEYDTRMWIGENGTGLLWSETSLNYGLLNAREMVQSSGN